VGVKYLGGREWTPRKLGAEQVSCGHHGAAAFGTLGVGASRWAEAFSVWGLQALCRALPTSETTSSGTF
jgi:hypothetical protein